MSIRVVHRIIHIQQRAAQILEGCMGTCLWWLKTPLRTLSVWKHIHKWTQLWYYKLHSLHSRLPSLDLVRCGEEGFLDQWKSSVIIHFSCFPWSFRPLGVCWLPSSPVPSFFLKIDQIIDAATREVSWIGPEITKKPAKKLLNSHVIYYLWAGDNIRSTAIFSFNISPWIKVADLHLDFKMHFKCIVVLCRCKIVSNASVLCFWVVFFFQNAGLQSRTEEE